MPITFEEVTGEIQPERRGEPAQGDGESPAPAGAGEDLQEQLQQQLRLMGERAARLCDA